MDANDVYRKIKEMSKRTANPRPPIMVVGIANELLMQRDSVMPFLEELKDLRLIQFNDRSFASIKLTLLGHTVQR